MQVVEDVVFKQPLIMDDYSLCCISFCLFAHFVVESKTKGGCISVSIDSIVEINNTEAYDIKQPQFGGFISIENSALRMHYNVVRDIEVVRSGPFLFSFKTWGSLSNTIVSQQKANLDILSFNERIGLNNIEYFNFTHNEMRTNELIDALNISQSCLVSSTSPLCAIYIKFYIKSNPTLNECVMVNNSKKFQFFFCISTTTTIKRSYFDSFGDCNLKVGRGSLLFNDCFVGDKNGVSEGITFTEGIPISIKEINPSVYTFTETDQPTAPFNQLPWTIALIVGSVLIVLGIVSGVLIYKALRWRRVSDEFDRQKSLLDELDANYG